ncbi:hypothetical protein [Falsiroseomonas tokyonensis]|uniref:Uncharacterized protein n=1 Tax=Falsiroseomonas tokyonensis TaxID=430521 RepID=A0ABV7C3N8_9PROT|nr:hypothetical protein [Falsiroseomonas tokyonensis]MBU8541245.1 hypothetical protein [Falsiroseomonas tokyonensis]
MADAEATLAPPARRRFLTTTAAAGLALVVARGAAAHPAPAPVPDADASLLALANRWRADGAPGEDAAILAALARTREAEAEYSSAVAADDDAAQAAAAERLEQAIADMAELQAEGLRGIALKATRLCRSLAEGGEGGTVISYADAPLARSLAADLARLEPVVITGAAPSHARVNPDAELVRLCATYQAAVDAYNADSGKLEAVDDPLWHRVQELEAKIDGIQPAGLAGVMAKARIAHVRAKAGESEPWATDVLNDMMRLFGHAAA